MWLQELGVIIFSHKRNEVSFKPIKYSQVSGYSPKLGTNKTLMKVLLISVSNFLFPIPGIDTYWASTVFQTMYEVLFSMENKFEIETFILHI